MKFFEQLITRLKEEEGANLSYSLDGPSKREEKDFEKEEQVPQKPKLSPANQEALAALSLEELEKLAYSLSSHEVSTWPLELREVKELRESNKLWFSIQGFVYDKRVQNEDGWRIMEGVLLLANLPTTKELVRRWRATQNKQTRELLNEAFLEFQHLVQEEASVALLQRKARQKELAREMLEEVEEPMPLLLGGPQQGLQDSVRKPWFKAL